MTEKQDGVRMKHRKSADLYIVLHSALQAPFQSLCTVSAQVFQIM